MKEINELIKQMEKQGCMAINLEDLLQSVAISTAQNIRSLADYIEATATDSTPIISKADGGDMRMEIGGLLIEAAENPDDEKAQADKFHGFVSLKITRL